MENEIVESYFKSMREYIFSGLVASQANGSYGEDLLAHFDLFAKHFKETVSLENKLGVDLPIVFSALKNGAWFNLDGFKDIDEKDKIMFIDNVSIGPLWQLCSRYNYKGKDRYVIVFPDQYKRTWALKKRDLK